MVYKLRKKEDIRIYFDEIENSYSENSKAWRFIYSWIDSVVYALVIILFIFTFLFRVVGVSGESMKPTLNNGDWLAVKAINTSYKPGDIVVVTQPNPLNEPLIKRVIAVGGDTVDIDIAEGTVSVNGNIISEPYILEPTQRRFDIAFPVTVPEGCVFVMGDNRNNSLDSRYSAIGFIDTRYLLGTAEFRFYPLGDWKLDK